MSRSGAGRPRPRVAVAVAGLATATALALVGCTSKPVLATDSDKVLVVTTTGLLRDLVENVGGDRVQVVSLVPDGADPHTYETTLRDARNVVYADVAFSNYALLEEHNIIRTVDANLSEDAVNVSIAEESVKYAAEIIPLVENAQLDTVWLGLRARGGGAEHGTTRSSQVELSATAASGPGEIYAYLTGTFGDTDIYIDSSDGFDATNGYEHDTATLPAEAHTHLSWAFTETGVYTLTLQAQLRVDDTSRPIRMGQETFTFAVGVNPETAVPGRTVIDQGHADLTVNIETRGLEVLYDPQGGGEHSQQILRPQDVVISVPAKAIDEIPAGQQYRFLGRPGDQIYQLPQAVLGKHVHGEIDPHLWQNVRNGMAYVQLIRDTLAGVDPAGTREYRGNTDAYLARLDEADTYMRQTIAKIPEESRHLITTHDAFGYLAHAHDVEIAGFVTSNPATEPSLSDRRRLSETLRALEVPAVFLEPNLVARSSTLTEVAAEQGVAVCPIWGDTFDGEVTTYLEMIHANADSLYECLAPSPSQDGTDS